MRHGPPPWFANNIADEKQLHAADPSRMTLSGKVLGKYPHWSRIAHTIRIASEIESDTVRRTQ